MIKKLLPLFLFVFIVFIFNSNNAHAIDCPAEGGEAGTVICGPTSPSGNGEILWKGENKNLGNVTVIQAQFNIRDKSRITMAPNSILSFDGGGCISNCSVSNPRERTYGINILELDNSEFYHGSGLNATVYMKDDNRIRLTSNSSATFGYIKEKEIGEWSETGSFTCPTSENGCYTKLEINVQNSELSIGSIEFENSDSWISTIRIENEEKNRGKLVNINNGIKASEISSIDLKYADANIGGDIIAYGRAGNGGVVSNINLYSSDLVLKGNLISQVQTIFLIEKSILKIDPQSGRHTAEFAGSSLIRLENSSEFIAQDIKLLAPNLNLTLINDGTKFTADRIYFSDNQLSFSDINFDLSLKSQAKIGSIDTRLNCIEGGNCSGVAQKITLNGDKDSNYDIGEILIDANSTTLLLNDSYGKINKIDYYNNEVRIDGRASKDTTMHIGNINLLNDNSIYDIEFRSQNLKIDNINLKKSDKLLFNFYDSTINVGNIICGESCSQIVFNGFGDTTLNIVTFNAGSTNSTNFSNDFSGITINASGSYNSNGTFNVKNSTLNFGSMNGEYDSINLESSNLILNRSSDIKLTSGNISIDTASSFTIKGEQIFENPNDINIVNNGKLNILAGNDFNSLTNNATATTVLDGKAKINTVNNTDGTVELYAGASIDLFNNLGSGTDKNRAEKHTSKLIVNGANRIEKYNHNEFSELVFMVSTKKSMPTLTIGEMGNSDYLGKMSISFDKLSVIKPGLINRYDLIKTEKGSIGIKHEDYDGLLDILPPWLKHQQNIDFNNGENAVNGETAWINIERLTNYTNLVRAVPGYGDDKSILTLAGNIDNAVFNSQVTLGLEDVVNSLDLNSGCGFSDEIIYKMHQGEEIIDISKAPCLYTMAENINKLKPVSNEVYALYSHTNVVRSLDTILEANREYVYDGEIYSWYKGDIGYTSLADKEKDSGFNSVNSMFYVGATVAPSSNYNFSGILGFGIGSLNGNKSLYDGVTNSLTAGLATSYLKATYFVSLSGIVGLTNFDTNRYIEFLDNEYSDNRETKSTSKLSVLELALKLEVGNEYIIDSTTFLTPKVFASQSVLNNSGYEEFGSSASLNVNANTLLISDIGVGVELRRELLLPSFLGIDKAFWYPKIGFNIVERFYQTPNTEMKFVGTSDDFYSKIDSGNYSGILGQLYGSLLYQNQAFALQVGYNGDASISGYMNHSINATLKYSFR